MASAPIGRVPWRQVTLIACEGALIVGVVALAAYLRLPEEDFSSARAKNGAWKALLIAAVCQVCLYYADLYDLRVVADRRGLFVRALQSLGAASLILAALYYVFPDLILGRGVFFIAAAFVVLIMVGW